MIRDDRGQARVECGDVGHAAPQHEHVGIDDVRHHRQRPAKPLRICLQRVGRMPIASIRRRDDFRPGQMPAAASRVIALEAGAGDHRFQTPRAPAPALERSDIGRQPRQGHMPPFPAKPVRALDQRASDGKPATHARSDDHAEHDMRALRRAVDRLRQHHAIGIVGDPHRPAERHAKIVSEPAPVQEFRIGIAHQAGARIGCARHAHADRSGLGDRALDLRDQRDDSVDRAVVAAGVGHALPRDDRSARIERRRLDLGAADVEADLHHRRIVRRDRPALCPAPGYNTHCLIVMAPPKACSDTKRAYHRKPN